MLATMDNLTTKGRLDRSKLSIFADLKLELPNITSRSQVITITELRAESPHEAEHLLSREKLN